MHDAWRMVRRVPTGAVWKTLECLNLGYLHKLAVHKAAWDAVDVLVGCPALRKGLNRTNVDVIFNQGGVIEVGRQLFPCIHDLFDSLHFFIDITRSVSGGHRDNKEARR